mmetsp:Transcript_530/g.2075  ORF Transcript_530/g.2075 Transcript_530/m.2075 type:complete len:202 (+) Transcript_530:394-999(+)
MLLRMSSSSSCSGLITAGPHLGGGEDVVLEVLDPGVEGSEVVAEKPREDDEGDGGGVGGRGLQQALCLVDEDPRGGLLRVVSAHDTVPADVARRPGRLERLLRPGAEPQLDDEPSPALGLLDRRRRADGEPAQPRRPARRFSAHDARIDHVSSSIVVRLNALAARRFFAPRGGRAEHARPEGVRRALRRALSVDAARALAC